MNCTYRNELSLVAQNLNHLFMRVTFMSLPSPGCSPMSRIQCQSLPHRHCSSPHKALPQGTSMACPHVAGTVALIISQAKAVGRTLTLAQILAALQDTAQPLSCPVVEPYVPYVRPPAHAGPGCVGVRVAVMIDVRAPRGRHYGRSSSWADSLLLPVLPVRPRFQPP